VDFISFSEEKFSKIRPVLPAPSRTISGVSDAGDEGFFHVVMFGVQGSRFRGRCSAFKVQGSGSEFNVRGLALDIAVGFNNCQKPGKVR